MTNSVVRQSLTLDVETAVATRRHPAGYHLERMAVVRAGDRKVPMVGHPASAAHLRQMEIWPRRILMPRVD